MAIEFQNSLCERNGFTPLLMMLDFVGKFLHRSDGWEYDSLFIVKLDNRGNSNCYSQKVNHFKNFIAKNSSRIAEE